MKSIKVLSVVPFPRCAGCGVLLFDLQESVCPTCDKRLRMVDKLKQLPLFPASQRLEAN